MRPLLAIFLFAWSFALPARSLAQDLEIKDDTIRVSPSAFPLMSFMGEIRDYQALCSDYKIAASTTTLTIRPNTSKPTKYCRLIVTEGSKGSPRQHQFILIFDKDADPSDQIHDYSTKDLLEKRIEFLEKSRKGADEPDDEKVSKKEKKKHKKDKDNEDEGTKSKGKDKDPEVAQDDAPAKDSKQKGKGSSKKEDGSDNASTKDKKQEYSTTSTTSTNTGENSGSGDKSEIRDIPTDLIEARVKLKINGFYRACELLCTKTDIPNSIKYAMKLFDNDEEVLVETTNGKTNAKSQSKIRQYLNHLSLLSYKKVEMTASNIKFVSKFHLGPDGKWHASAVILQDFKGYKDNVQVYKDQTNKTIDIIVNTFEEEKDGKTVTKFDIFLGNISVTNIPS